MRSSGSPSLGGQLGSDSDELRSRHRLPNFAASRADDQRGYSGFMSAPGEILEQHRTAITEVASRHNVRSVSVFGSVARGDDTATSDIDFLVEFEPGSSLFDLMHLREALEELLGRAVDVVSVGALTERDDHILSEAIPL